MSLAASTFIYNNNIIIHRVLSFALRTCPGMHYKQAKNLIKKVFWVVFWIVCGRLCHKKCWRQSIPCEWATVEECTLAHGHTTSR